MQVVLLALVEGSLGTLLVAAATMGVLAIVFGWVLGWANRTFWVEVDPRIEAVNDALPGANCGGCGYVGCGEYAEAVVKDDAPIDLCAPGGAGCAEAIGAIMGKDVADTAPMRPVMHCAATSDQRLKKIPYTGEPTCAAANLVSGIQGCTYGCIGFGDCEESCPYDAIHIVDGLARIDYGRCTGCGNCVKACPRNLLSLIPFKAERMFVISCCNQDFGAEVREVCEVGCIGCKACSKKSELITMEGNLPTLNYDAYDPETADFEAAMEKCPRKSMVWVGKPTEKHLEQTKDEELPAVIKGDPKSTVDDAEWRG